MVLATRRCCFVHNKHHGLLCSFAEHAVFSNMPGSHFTQSVKQRAFGRELWEITLPLKRQNYLGFKIKSPLGLIASCWFFLFKLFTRLLYWNLFKKYMMFTEWNWKSYFLLSPLLLPSTEVTTINNLLFLT